ncbi:unnamed protein product, partial [Mesorhabditis belari]|uniref:Uncharacterized protein n=1 Tax=Mesorhabditis belari TaxID=2138241 RepID=A0AAF3EM71_9BILA
MEFHRIPSNELATAQSISRRASSSSSRHSSNDVSSLCGEIMSMPPQTATTQPTQTPLTYAQSSSQLGTSSTTGTTTTTSTSTEGVAGRYRVYNTGQDVTAKHLEQLCVVPSALQATNDGVVCVQPFVTILEYPDLGRNEQHAKHAERGSNNPWRKHGALSKICEIGGMVHVGDRKQKQYKCVMPGSSTPCAPETPEMTLNRDKTRASLLDTLQLNQGVPAAQLACDMALAIETLVAETCDFIEQPSSTVDGSKNGETTSTRAETGNEKEKKI